MVEKHQRLLKIGHINSVCVLIKTFSLTEQWRLKLREYTPYFKEQEDKKANEALRPGAPKTADDLFGMDGTFRKLTID